MQFPDLRAASGEFGGAGLDTSFGQIRMRDSGPEGEELFGGRPADPRAPPV
jgi:hypothetical protein